MFYEGIARWIKKILNHLKTEETCDKAVHISPYALDYVPDRFITQEICNDTVYREVCPQPS